MNNEQIEVFIYSKPGCSQSQGASLTAWDVKHNTAHSLSVGRTLTHMCTQTHTQIHTHTHAKTHKAEREHTQPLYKHAQKAVNSLT